MLFFALITLIICKALLHERLTSYFFLRITILILLFTAFLNYNTLFNFEIATGIGINNGLFHITYITQIIEMFLLIIGSIVLISWPNTNQLITEINIESNINYSILNNNTFLLGSRNYSINYSIIVLFCTLGASLLISCSDLISMYLSIELQSFSLYVLSTLYKDSELSTSAGLKYFLLGGLSSCLILFGAGLIYAYTGLTNFESLYSFLSIYSIEINNNYIQIFNPFFQLGTAEYIGSIFLGFIFIFVGFLFKISAAPFHNWSPDVYDDTPTIVTIWLTLIPKISILVLLLELHIHIDLIDQLSLFGQLELFNFNIDTAAPSSYGFASSFGSEGEQYIKNLLLISSLLSLIIGSVVGLAQNRIKRLLAYSTISHIGYILLALGIYTEQSIDSFIFYILQYIITNLNIFLIIIALSYIINQAPGVGGLHIIKDIRYISEFKGQFYLNPLISLSLSICLFSIAGIPPLMGFFSKQFVLYSAIQSGYNFIALVAIFVSVISASYYLKIIKTFFIDFDSPSQQHSSGLKVMDYSQSQPSESEAPNSYSKLSNIHSFTISTLTMLILFFIFKPSLILNITQLLSLSLFYI